MSTITDFVDIQITRETQAVARASFSVPCFIAAHTAFSERAREYTSLEGVAEDFISTSNTYKAAQKYFGQELTPEKIVVGRRQVNSVTVTPSVANTTLYSLIINATTYSFTSDGSATALEICAGLDSAVGSVSGITCVDNLDGTLTVGVAVSGTAWSLTSTANITLTNASPSETWADTINAVQDENDTWYFLSVESHSDATILAVAAEIETKKKLYAYSTADSGVRSSSTSDIASQLKALAYDRSFGIWSANSATEFPECAWVGSQAQATPGSNTWAFKTLTGITVDRQTATQSGYLVSKNIASYETIGGVNVTTEGKVASGEYIDVMIGVDWTESRMTEGVWFVLVNNAKVPYTQAGISQVEAQVRRVLSEGIRNGLYTDNPQPIIVVPDAVTVDAGDRSTRTLRGVTFEARLAGAIHKVIVRGVVGV